MSGGELSYRHTFDSDLTAYVSLSRGYKAGGFNLGIVPAGQRAFAEEALWNAETGFKATLANGRLQLNASAFYYLRKDQQVETSVQLIPNDPASFVFFTDNAAEGEAFGMETELVWLPADNLELFASIGLLRAKFDSFSTPFTDLGGRDQAHAPRYTFAGGGVFRFGDALFARLDVTAKDEFYFDVSHDQKSESYALANLRLGYDAERWTAQLYIRNLFDERYAVRGFYFGNEPPDFPPQLYIRQGDPRQVGVIFEMRY
jgi:outer membrane receptor protein involved in Fe transport